MEPTQTVVRRSRGRWLILLGILLSALTLSGIAASPAMAEDGSTDSPSSEEEFEFFFAGNVTFDDEPLEGVEITVEGGGFEASTETDADGRWTLGVPEKAEYEQDQRAGLGDAGRGTRRERGQVDGAVIARVRVRAVIPQRIVLKDDRVAGPLDRHASPIRWVRRARQC